MLTLIMERHQTPVAKAQLKTITVACPKKLVLVRKHQLWASTSKSHFLKPLMFTIVKYVKQALITAVSWKIFFLRILQAEH